MVLKYVFEMLLKLLCEMVYTSCYFAKCHFIFREILALDEVAGTSENIVYFSLFLL